MSEVSSLCSGLQKVGSGPHVAAPVQITKDDVRERYQRQRDLSKIRVIPAKPEANPFDTNTRKRVVVYCRVSTDDIQQTSSFELQKNYYLRFVRKKPEWKLVGLYSDEGITATSTDHRIGMLTMLEDARAGKFDIIVVKNLSRFSRNLMDCMKIIYELCDLPHPVGILFETENMYTLDKNVDFTLQVLSLVAQEESHKKSEAMNSSYQMRFSNGQFTKAVSFKDEKLFELIERFVNEAGYRGQIDIDIFEVNGEYYISEVNPRFGGGYPHAYESGADHMKYIVSNLNGLENRKIVGNNYQSDTIMMKYNEIMFLNGER